MKQGQATYAKQRKQANQSWAFQSGSVSKDGPVDTNTAELHVDCTSRVHYCGGI